MESSADEGEKVGRDFDESACEFCDDYKKSGLSRSSKILFDFLVEEGVKDRSVLEVGSGAGGFLIELLKQGASSAAGIDLSSETNIERKPTKPLRLDQAGLPAAESLSPGVQSAKEAWIAAESAMQQARNAAYGIATSISFLSQDDGLSNEFMEELVRKQADANKAQLKAQDAARAAYERYVQAQRDTESAARLPVDAPMNSSEDHSQQKQEHASLPPAEGNGTDQTAKLHAIRLYKEW